MSTNFPILLSHTDAKKLVLSVLATRGKGGATEEELQQVLNWAERTEREHTILQAVLVGAALVDYDEENDELVFHRTDKYIGEAGRDALQRELALLDEEESTWEKKPAPQNESMDEPVKPENVTT